MFFDWTVGLNEWMRRVITEYSFFASNNELLYLNTVDLFWFWRFFFLLVCRWCIIGIVCIKFFLVFVFLAGSELPHLIYGQWNLISPLACGFFTSHILIELLLPVIITRFIAFFQSLLFIFWDCGNIYSEKWYALTTTGWYHYSERINKIENTSMGLKIKGLRYNFRNY